MDNYTGLGHLWEVPTLSLPFLKLKNQAPVSGLIVKTRAADAPKEDQDDPKAAIMSCARDLINAIHSRDEAATAEAIQAIIDVVEPSADDSDASPHSYDAQNAAAAKGNL